MCVTSQCFLSNREILALHNLLFLLKPTYISKIGLTHEDSEALFSAFRKLRDVVDIIETNEVKI